MMPGRLKRPIIVIVAVREELLNDVQGWRHEQHLLTAQRVYPKGEPNYGPLTTQQLLQKIRYYQTLASRHHLTPRKTIVVTDNEDVLYEVIEELSNQRFYNPKHYEYHLVAEAGEMAKTDPHRVGFFVPKSKK